jgi:hypothetical protein
MEVQTVSLVFFLELSSGNQFCALASNEVTALDSLKEAVIDGLVVALSSSHSSLQLPVFQESLYAPGDVRISLQGPPTCKVQSDMIPPSGMTVDNVSAMLSTSLGSVLAHSFT